MKRTILILAMLAFATSGGVQAATIIDANNELYTLSGSTIVRAGNLASFPGGTSRWQTNVAEGSARKGVTATPVTSTDYYFIFQGNDLSSTGNLIPVAQNRYVEISFSHSTSWVGDPETLPDQFRLGTSNQGLTNTQWTNRDLIPPGSAGGAQSIIVDMTDGGSSFTGDWEQLRWDFFNTSGNGNKTFKVLGLEFANSLTAIPEPSTFALTVGALALLTRIRRRR